MIDEIANYQRYSCIYIYIKMCSDLQILYLVRDQFPRHVAGDQDFAESYYCRHVSVLSLRLLAVPSRAIKCSLKMGVLTEMKHRERNHILANKKDGNSR